MPSRLASLAAYVPLQAALLPAGLAGMATSGFLQSTVSRRLGVSQTAVQVLSGRYAMHRFGIREDVAAAKLFQDISSDVLDMDVVDAVSCSFCSRDARSIEGFEKIWDEMFYLPIAL